MDRHFWACRLRSAIEQRKAVLLYRAGLFGQRNLVAIIDRDRTIYSQDETKLLLDKDEEATTFKLDNPAGLARQAAKCRTKPNKVTLTLSDLGLGFELDRKSSSRAIPYLVGRILSACKSQGCLSPANIELESDLGITVNLRTHGMAARVPYKVFRMLDPVIPGEYFKVGNVIHRLETPEGTLGRDLARSLSVALKMTFSEARSFRHLLKRLLEPHIIPMAGTLSRLASQLKSRYGSGTVTSITVPFSIRSGSIGQTELLCILAAVVTGTRLSERRYRLMNAIPSPAASTPRWYSVPICPTTLVKRRLWHSQFYPAESDVIHTALYYWHGLRLQPSPLLSAVVELDLHSGMATVYQNGCVVSGPFPAASNLPIRCRGCFRYSISPGLGLSNCADDAYMPLVSVYWRSYREFLEVFRLYRNLDQAGYGAPIGMRGSDELVRYLIVSALPRRIMVSDLAGLSFYLYHRRYLDLLEKSIPTWRDSYAVALDVASSSSVDDVSEAIEWALEM